METIDVAKLISGFNTIAVSVSVFLAALGAFVLVGKFAGLNIFSRRPFLRALFIAALAAFLPELTYFNYQHYLKFFAGEEIYTTYLDPNDPGAILLSNGGSAEVFSVKGDRGGVKSGVRFKDPGVKITSLFVDLRFDYDAITNMSVKWTDEEGSSNTFVKTLFKGFPHDNYAPLQPRGMVKDLEVAFEATGADVSLLHIALNRTIPFYFSGLRLLAVTLLLFAVFVLVSGELRAGAAFYLFEYKFAPANKKQTAVYALMVAALVALVWVSVYTSDATKLKTSAPQHQMYNKYLVDAIIAGRTWLDYGNPEQMLSWERPYDHVWRNANNKKLNEEWMWEWCWYKGKYYSHYGVVPAVILYVPYKLVTGDYLSNHGGIFVMSAVAVIMLALLWRHCVKKYMPDTKFAFYILGYLILFFTCGIHSVLVFTRFYSIPQAGAFMFAVAGVYLLLKAIENDEKINRLKLFFACLCLALIAGCRPNMLFVSLLVPILLWKHRSWKLLAFAAIPYVIVAVPLGWYNYVRFDSFSDFGHLYTLTSTNHPSHDLLNPLGRTVKAFYIFLHYLFVPNKLSLYFPYSEVFARPENDITQGMLMSVESCTGLVNYPIVFCLLYMLGSIFAKVKLQARNLLSGSLLVAVVIMIPIAWSFHPSSRYLADFTIFVILPSLFCAYYWCNATKSELHGRARMKCVYVLMGISMLTGAALYVTGGLNYEMFRNPLMYRYLEYSLGIIRGV